MVKGHLWYLEAAGRGQAGVAQALAGTGAPSCGERSGFPTLRAAAREQRGQPGAGSQEAGFYRGTALWAGTGP